MKKPKNKLLKKIGRRLKKLTAWRGNKKKETALQGKSPLFPALPNQSKKNLNGRSSKLPLMKVENTSPPDPKKNNMGILPHKYGSNIPPEVAAELDKIVSEMVSKVEPEMQRIALILKQHGIPGTSIELMMGAINPEKLFGFPFRPDPSMPPNTFRFEPPQPQAPADDLVEGIYSILNINYDNYPFNVLGAVFDHNHNVAYEISKVMEAARKRDRESLTRELEGLATKIRSK